MKEYVVLVIVNICSAVLTSLAVCQSIYYMNLRQNLAYDGDEAAAKRIILPIYKPVLIGIAILYLVFALSLGLTLSDPNWENRTYFKILQYFQFTCIFLYTIIPTLLLQPSVSYSAFKNVAIMLLPWWLITTIFWLATFVGNHLEIIFVLIFILSASILPGLLSISILTRFFKSRVEILSTSNRNAMEFLLLYCFIFCSLYSVCLFYDKNFNSVVTYHISLAITICSCVFNQLFPFALYRTLLADTKFWRGLGSHNKGIKVSSENNMDGNDSSNNDDMNIHRPVNLNLAIASSTFQRMMIDMGDLLIDFAILEINTQIGKGATSQVYRGKYRKKIVAIKLSTPPEITQEVINSFTAEAKIAASLKHPNIVHFIGICVRPPQIAMVLEYCEGGNLKHNLQVHYKEWTQLRRLKACLDACKSIECLHKHMIIHRDLKAENFFVGRKNIVKLGDFGESTKFRSQESTQSKRMTILGTVAFMAPELIDANKYYTEAIDIYALAITMWEIWTGEDPYKEFSQFEIYDKVKGGYRPILPTNSPKEFNEILEKSWHEDYKIRPNATELCIHIQKIITKLMNIGPPIEDEIDDKISIISRNTSNDSLSDVNKQRKTSYSNSMKSFTSSDINERETVATGIVNNSNIFNPVYYSYNNDNSSKDILNSDIEMNSINSIN